MEIKKILSDGILVKRIYPNRPGSEIGLELPEGTLEKLDRENQMQTGEAIMVGKTRDVRVGHHVIYPRFEAFPVEELGDEHYIVSEKLVHAYVT